MVFSNYYRGFAAMLFLALTLPTPTSGAGLGIVDSARFWESRAFYCELGSSPFPSKEAHSGSTSQECDDGDMTLFNGLLCAAGDDRGCDAVKRAQDSAGRFWRSPRRHGMDSSNGHDVSFSEDQAFGVMLYLLKTDDAPAFQKWANWISDSRPCLWRQSGSCRLWGWPRFCTDDAQDNRCALRPMNCLVFDVLAERLGKPVRSAGRPGLGCDLVMGVTFAAVRGFAPALDDLIDLLNLIDGLDVTDLAAEVDKMFPCGWPPELGNIAGGLRVRDLLDVFRTLSSDGGFGHAGAYPLSAQLKVEAGVTCSGYPLHKVAVRLLILDEIRPRDANANAAASYLIDPVEAHHKQPFNPFFRLLVDNNDSGVTGLIADQCPTPDRPSEYRFQWMWERADGAKPWLPPAEGWRNSMYWECIFLAKLMGAQND